MSHPSRKIVVTAGAGYVGSCICAELSKRPDYDVLAFDALRLAHIDYSTWKVNVGATLLVGDILELDQLRAAFQNANAVVHLAGMVGDNYCNLNPLEARETNVGGTRNVLNIAVDCGVPRIIFASTCSVYGITNGDRLLHEGADLNPVSLYSESKIQAEELFAHMLHDNVIDATILRFGTAFGTSFSTRFDLLLNSLTYDAFTRGRIEIYGPHSWRPFVHVCDMCKIIAVLLDQPSRFRNKLIWNAGHSLGNKTKLDLAYELRDKLPSVEIKIHEDQQDQRSYRVDFSELQKAGGVFEPVSTRDGISEVFHALRLGRISATYVKADRRARGH